jgi:ABC-type transport system involved in multi-copper enzyme maturation permease subunit
MTLETPDALFVVKVLVSLIALFFSAGAVTREKEDGTLRTLLANPLSRRDLLSGKALGAAICVIVPTGIAFLCALIYVNVLRGIIFEPEDWARVLLLFVFALLYALVFVSLGLLISTFTRRTATALVVGLLIWGAAVLVLPDAAVLIAEGAAPAPSYDQVNARLRQEWNQMMSAQLRAHPDAVSIFDVPESRGEIISQIERERQVMDDYFSRMSQQVRDAKLFTSLSPAGAVTFGMTDLAGTGSDAYEAFNYSLRAGRNEAISNYKRRFGNRDAAAGGYSASTRGPSLPLMRPGTIVSALLSAVPCIMSLLLWLSLSAAAAYLRFERYDVR